MVAVFHVVVDSEGDDDMEDACDASIPLVGGEDEDRARDLLGFEAVDCDCGCGCGRWSRGDMLIESDADDRGTWRGLIESDVDDSGVGRGLIEAAEPMLFPDPDRELVGEPIEVDWNRRTGVGNDADKPSISFIFTLGLSTPAPARDCDGRAEDPAPGAIDSVGESDPNRLRGLVLPVSRWTEESLTAARLVHRLPKRKRFLKSSLFSSESALVNLSDPCKRGADCEPGRLGGERGDCARICSTSFCGVMGALVSLVSFGMGVISSLAVDPRRSLWFKKLFSVPEAGTGGGVEGETMRCWGVAGLSDCFSVSGEITLADFVQSMVAARSLGWLVLVGVAPRSGVDALLGTDDFHMLMNCLSTLLYRYT